MLPTLFRLLARLPLAWVHALGAAIGWLAYLASPTYRRTLRANLAQAGLDEPVLRRAAIGHAGRQGIEAAWLWQRPVEDIARCVQEAEPGALAELLDDEHARGRGDRRGGGGIDPFGHRHVPRGASALATAARNSFRLSGLPT